MLLRCLLVVLRSVLLMPLFGIAVACAYPGADAGPKPWQPPRGKPSPLAGLMLVPPSEVLRALHEAGIPTSQIGFYARRVDARRPFAALNEEQPFVLASTAKVVTSLAALDLLGPDYRWTTQAFAKGELADGRLDGDLLLVGGGDALLSSEALRHWFARLHEQGLREVTGNIVLDRFAFALSADDFARTPRPDPDRPHHIWPDAFSLDEGVLRVEVQAMPKGRAEVRLLPALADVKVVSTFATGPGCQAHAAFEGAPATTMTLKVVATVAPECGVQRIAFVPLTHAEFTTRAVAALWAESGGVLKGRVLDRSVPPSAAGPSNDGAGEADRPFALHVSEKLPGVVREINKTSNNLLARNLMLSLAPGFPQRPATLEAARERVQGWLRAQGLAADDIEIDSGSGLSRLERGKARAMVQLLAQAWRGAAAKPFVESLPIAGVDGTLANRFQHGPAAGQAWLKTGTLLDARALAGYVKAKSGKVYAIAVMVNHPEAARATPALDALVEWLAREG
ncbi:MAG TPA: D-alanyl-D-alanine carboxypeptidase/D-alanyl-D-alanine-endopeptidase [Burkholderiaceae bacterium]|nr:D-alanyl-D-alanine carboxypeptidase/D-alanyl-D-alanine-endopeptidase [Burkholderiaceae bacterium]